VVFSTHVLQQAEELCERIFLINRGVKLLDATIQDIHERFDPKTILLEPMNGEIDWRQIRGVVSANRVNGNGRLELTLHDDAEPLCVMRNAMSLFALRAVELRRPTLTDVFVRLVSQDQGAAAAAVAREELSRA
jgi:ABC-2 type transport system ATP-binding protein